MKYACNRLKHQNNQNVYFHNFEAVLGFGEFIGYIVRTLEKISKQRKTSKQKQPINRDNI